MKFWNAVNDDKTCAGCRFRHGREIKEGGAPAPPYAKCKNEHGCRCFTTDLKQSVQVTKTREPKPKLLWIGDAVAATGFARATHYTLDVLRETWDVTVLGLNYLGDPHQYPYPIYPCYPGGDAFGYGRTKEIVGKVKPDLIVLQNDPWNIPAYLKLIKQVDENVPVAAVVAVDGKNCRGTPLNDLDLAIFWTRFGAEEAKLGGYLGQSEVIPLGVDLDIYKPLPRGEARATLGLPEHMLKGFIVGNINRNQPRKRLDLTIAYFAEWVKTRNVQDAYLYLHVAPTGEESYDVTQLMHYYGMKGRLILSQPDRGLGDPESFVVQAYNCFDVQVTTTQGEGFGLTTLEGMACGIRQILPAWSALEEWAKDAALMIPCHETITTPNTINVVGGVPSRKEFVEALDLLYRSEDVREDYRVRALALAARPEYRWRNIGEKFAETLEQFRDPGLREAANG